MSCKVMLLVVIIVKDPAFGSSHKKLINISLHVVGKLEYWNTGILVRKSERCPIWEYQNTHVSYEVDGSPQPIIPLFPSHNLLDSQLFVTLAMRDRQGPSEIPHRGGGPGFSRLNNHANEIIRIFMHVK